MSELPKSSTTVDLIKDALGANGELHLDATSVVILLKFAEADVRQLAAANTCIFDLCKALDKFIDHPSEPTNT